MYEKKTHRNREHLVARLTEVLADTFVLFNTTQFCHWNVVGRAFHSLHRMFEAQYREMFEAVDLIAERIRILGYSTPGTLEDYVRLSNVKQRADQRTPEDMLQTLIEGHDLVAVRLETAIDAAQAAGDIATEDMLVERLRAHETAGWMLRAQIGHPPRKLELNLPERPLRSAESA